MSTQSIIHNTDGKISTQVSSFLRDAGVKYMLKRRFDVGCKMKPEEYRRIIRLVEIFCEDACSIETEDFTKLKEKINSLLIFDIPEL